MRWLLFCLLLVGCSADNEKVKQILEGDGCVGTIVEGWSLSCGFTCGNNDSFANGFRCYKNNHLLKGCVCSGWLKGYTIRYE